MHLHRLILQKTLPLVLAAVLAVSLFSGCQRNSDTEQQPLSSEIQSENDDFMAFTDDLFLTEISANTINLHYTVHNPQSIGITDYAISLGDFSKESRETSSLYIEESIQDLESFDYELLTVENKLTYDTLMDYLQTQLNFCSFDLYQEPLSHSGGLQMELPILFAEYAFNCEQDVIDYLELIALTDEYFCQVMEFEAEKSDNGLFMSQELCELVIDSCESFLLEQEEHYLVTTFESKVKALNLSSAKEASYIRQNQMILEKQLFPAYSSMITALEELKDTGTNDGGVCHFENGKSYYELLVRSETGCEDSVDVIYRRIENQRLLDLLTCSELQSENSHLIEECSSLTWSMDTPQQMLTQLEEAILADFPAPPNCNYEINYVVPDLEEYLSPAFYIVAPIDNYQDNVIYINELYISSDIYAFTTLAHEGYPGHLYQTAMTYEYDYPWVRSLLSFPGYVEGWATYVEMTSYHYAGLEEDVATFLSCNQSATLSLYATSDIGLHYYGWSEADMLDFWAGYGITNEYVVKEITQLILSEPGNYLKYYVGYLEFLELKDFAKDLQGWSYSDTEFHSAILDIGPTSFSILEKNLSFYY